MVNFTSQVIRQRTEQINRLKIRINTQKHTIPSAKQSYSLNIFCIKMLNTNRFFYPNTDLTACLQMFHQQINSLSSNAYDGRHAAMHSNNNY